MSIIQEALKKVQKNTQEVKEIKDIPAQDEKIGQSAFLKRINTAIKKRSVSKKVYEPVAIITVAAIILILGFIAATQFMPQKTTTGQSQKPKVEQEVTYRPISNIIPKSFKDSFENTAEIYGSEQAQFPDLMLNGIMYVEDAPMAIINDMIVGVGDTIKGARVTKITRKSVMLLFKETEITLSLK